MIFASQLTFPQTIIKHLLVPAIGAYLFLLFIYIIMGWLAAFGVVNMRNPNVRQIYFALERLANITLNPIRRFIPPIGGLDLSPIVVFLGLMWFSDGVLMEWLFPRLGNNISI